MSANLPSGAPGVLAALADDLRLLARLHDRELDRETLEELLGDAPENWLAMKLTAEDARLGFRLVSTFLAEYAANPEQRDQELEALAADYADLYLTFGKRLSPTESFWLTEDHIERQEPMFEVRRWYHHHGLSAGNWRLRPDDHLVHQLEFVAHLLAQGQAIPALDAGRFLDRHLLRWSQSFLGGMAKQAGTAFYAGLALLTEAALQATRTALEEMTGEARLATDPAAASPRPEVAEAGFLPGLAPSW